MIEKPPYAIATDVLFLTKSARSLKKLVRLDKAISRSQKVHGRKRKSKRRECLKKVHERVRDLRLDVAHKSTTALAKIDRHKGCYR